MTNYDIADQFSLLSKLMDIHGENSFKVKSYSIAAYNIEKLPSELSQMDDAAIVSAKGIGDNIGRKIREILDTGKMAALEELLMRTPPGVLEMMQIKGLGPKKVGAIWKEMGIDTLGELEYACNENRLAAMKGFGLKTQESILQSIAFYRSNQGFQLWAAVEVPGNNLVANLRNRYPGNNFSLTGDIRMQMDVVSAIDVLTDLPQQSLLPFIQSISDAQVAVEGDVVKLHIPGHPAVIFHHTQKENFFRHLFIGSASDTFNSAFAAKYSFPDHCNTEEEIFTANGLAFIPPALRTSPEIINKAAENELPQLITATDIKGIIHSHSTWSDGQHTIEQMALAAIEKGFEYLVLSDHSQSAFYANGLSPERIAAQHQEIDRLNMQLAPFRIFKSIEADILNDGSLDYSDSVLATFDLVIASVHSNLSMSQEKAMNRLLQAIRNPYTTVLGHPTGRLLLSREGYPLDHKAIIDACAEHGVVIEINAHPRRLDLDWKWISYALEKGVLLSVDPDAHSVEGFHDIHYGCMAAQKGGLTAGRNLSSFGLRELEQFLESKKRTA